MKRWFIVIASLIGVIGGGALMMTYALIFRLSMQREQSMKKRILSFSSINRRSQGRSSIRTMRHFGKIG